MSETGTDHGDLCMACGLCCSGALFEWVRLSPDEGGLIEELGLAPHEGAEPGFAQPCTRFAGCCTVYDQRPSACRRYSCEVLRRIDAGEIEAAAGQAAIAKALELVDQIEGGAPGSLRQLRAEAASDPQGWREGDPAGLATRAERNLALIALERHLDRHFRKPHQQQVMEG